MGPGGPRPRGRRFPRTMDITGGQSSHAVSAFEVTGTIGTREPAYPSLPQGESIGQPPACQLPSAALAPSFLGRDGGGGAPDVASLELLGRPRSAAPVSVPGLRPRNPLDIGPSTHPLTHPEPERWTGRPPPLVVLGDDPIRPAFGFRCSWVQRAQVRSPASARKGLLTRCPESSSTARHSASGTTLPQRPASLVDICCHCRRQDRIGRGAPPRPAARRGRC
jgi:hypothetical protein